MRRRAAAESAHDPRATGPAARRALTRALRAEDGFSLVEVMIAVTVLSFGLLALASVAMASMVSLRDSRLRQQATEAATTVLENARDLGYHALENNTGDVHVAGSTYDPDGAGCMGAENLIKSATGAVTGAPYVVGPVTPLPGQLTVRTYVTDVANLRCGVASPPPIPAARVTVVVSWPHGTTVREMHKSTVVAYAQRGVGIPNFEVTPRIQVSVGSPGVQCIAHTLVNQGIADTYEVVTVLPADFALTVYDDANRNGQPEINEAVPEFGGIPRTDVVATFGSKDLLFCYEVWDGARVEIITPRVRSFFDNSVSILLTHTVTTTDQLRFTLHAGNTNAADEARPFPAPPLDFANRPAFLMDPILPAPQGSAQLFNEEDPAIDANLGAWMPRVARPDAQPLEDPNDWDHPAHLRWDWQAPLGTTVAGAGVYRIWLAPTDALGTPPTILGVPQPYVPKNVAVRFRLWHLDENRNPVALMAESPVVLGADDNAPHLTWGWQQRLRPFAVVGVHEVLKNHWIRLELVCDAVESAQDCHAAMDTNNGVLQEYYSYLQLGLV